MADTDLNRVFGRLTPNSTWALNKSDPPHVVVFWGGPDTQPTPSEISDEWAIIEVEDAVAAAAESDMQDAYNDALVDFKGLAVWQKQMTGAQMAAYIDTNVTDLASAKIVLAGLAELLATVRDVCKMFYLAGE